MAPHCVATGCNRIMCHGVSKLWIAYNVGMWDREEEENLMAI